MDRHDLAPTTWLIRPLPRLTHRSLLLKGLLDMEREKRHGIPTAYRCLKMTTRHFHEYLGAKAAKDVGLTFITTKLTGTLFATRLISHEPLRRAWLRPTRAFLLNVPWDNGGIFLSLCFT